MKCSYCTYRNQCSFEFSAYAFHNLCTNGELALIDWDKWQAIEV
jgi:hypothetical protein